MRNSLREMNAAFQFALARSCGHSEGCHHIRHRVSWEQNMQVSCLVRAQLGVSNTSPCEWSLYLAPRQSHQLWLEILTALLLQQRRWDRPLGSAHFATVKCQLIQQFATVQVTKCASPSVRWTQLFSSLWPDLLDIRRFAITWSCSSQEQSGHFTRGLRPCLHFNTAPFQKDVDLLWFEQIHEECGSLAQICADVFLGSLPHKDIGIGKVISVPGCSKLAYLTASWNNFFYKFQRGLSGVHPDKSAASICQLKQWSSQQPSCLDYIVLDDRLPVMAATCERGVTATREGSPLVQLQQPATQILTALLLQQRRWDRPLGTVHFATVKCQLIQQFCDHPSHKMCKSISEMNAAVQFALARSCGHSEGCHHIRHRVSWEQNMQVSCLVRAQLEVSNTSPCEWSLYLALVLWKWTTGLPLRQPMSRQLLCSQAKSSALAGAVWTLHEGAWNVSSYLFRPCLHFNTAPFQKDVDLLWFQQIHEECGCQLIQQFCDHPSHKMCNSLSEMNSAFQFDLARPSGHSEVCHHMKLLQTRVNAVRLILQSGMPNDDKLGFTKFQFQLLLSNFAFGSHALNIANLFVLEKTQTPSFVMLSFKS